MLRINSTQLIINQSFNHKLNATNNVAFKMQVNSTGPEVSRRSFDPSGLAGSESDAAFGVANLNLTTSSNSDADSNTEELFYLLRYGKTDEFIF